jgi:hypothetical protein
MQNEKRNNANHKREKGEEGKGTALENALTKGRESERAEGRVGRKREAPARRAKRARKRQKLERWQGARLLHIFLRCRCWLTPE